MVQQFNNHNKNNIKDPRLGFLCPTACFGWLWPLQGSSCNYLEKGRTEQLIIGQNLLNWEEQKSIFWIQIIQCQSIRLKRVIECSGFTRVQGLIWMTMMVWWFCSVFGYSLWTRQYCEWVKISILNDMLGKRKGEVFIETVIYINPIEANRLWVRLNCKWSEGCVSRKEPNNYSIHKCRRCFNANE